MNNKADWIYHYEEHREISTRLTWIILIVFSVMILGWGMLLMMMVMDMPRQWSFWVYPDAPGESVYSTYYGLPGSKPERQIAPLPGSTKNEGPIPPGPKMPVDGCGKNPGK